MINTLVLAVHVACGTAGLVVGPMAMRSRKGPGRHPRLGRIYQGLTLGLCLTACMLVVLHPPMWPLAVIAVLTEAAALGGWHVRRTARPGWLRHHIALMCGSYVSFVTAFLVVNFRGSWIPWVLPTVIATPLITRAALAAAAAERHQAKLVPTS